MCSIRRIQPTYALIFLRWRLDQIPCARKYNLLGTKNPAGLVQSPSDNRAISGDSFFSYRTQRRGETSSDFSRVLGSSRSRDSAVLRPRLMASFRPASRFRCRARTRAHARLQFTGLSPAGCFAARLHLRSRRDKFLTPGAEHEASNLPLQRETRVDIQCGAHKHALRKHAPASCTSLNRGDYRRPAACF